MANPRQRNKARSHKATKPTQAAIKKLHHKLKKAPPLKGPEVLQQGWDKKKTVFQNYAALGLLPSIPFPKQPTSGSVALPVHPSTSTAAFGRIVRDDEGNVVDIILDEEEADVAMEEDDTEKSDRIEAKTEVVRSLEKLSETAAPVVRYSSTSETAWLKNMVVKYGDDYEAMTRDHKVNVWQKTQGEIKRMIKKAGGVEKLQKA
ncbi:nucleolar protein 16, partial [Tremellales sp. Uapishka_1]